MIKISEIESLINFNKRVLYQGLVKRNKKYSIEELKNLLMFNNIFISNMNELFGKYDSSDIINIYIKLLKIYSSNIEIIRKKLHEMNPEIEFVFDIKNKERKMLGEKILSNKINSININKIEKMNFDKNKIYYLSITDEEILLSYMDDEVYNKPFGFIIDNKKYFWKSDLFIKHYISEKYNTKHTLIFKVCNDLDNINKIKKIEYYGDINILKGLRKLFDKDTIFVSNNYLYIDDLNKMIQNNKNTKSFKKIDISNINKEDVLFEYPKNKSSDFINILYKASNDENVKSINMTIYRIGHNPTIFNILKNAVKNGIQVFVNIELKARGEDINYVWVKKMRECGIVVNSFMFESLKIHTKLILITYKDGKILSNIATGNYNINTMEQYTDFSLFTPDKYIGYSVTQIFSLFNFGWMDYINKDIWVTKFNAREYLMKAIQKESHSNGLIIIKCNSLNDKIIINLLSEAADNGCEIKLIIRGVCTWVPQQKNVEIRSYVWDKLEHSRLYLFGRGNPQIYLGSLDLVKNKLDKRIETMVRIKDNKIKKDLISYLDNYVYGKNYWIMNKYGNYERRR